MFRGNYSRKGQSCTYYQATKGGGNGDYSVPVLTPETVQELGEFTQKAFHIADKYRTPVMVLCDGVLAQMMEPVEEIKPLYNETFNKDDWSVGIGGDPVIGTTHIDCLRAFQDDPETTAIVMIGEIGGDAEERAAAFIAEYVTKPVVGYVAGFTAPEGKTMGHAGAIVSGSSGTAQGKKDALEAAGVKVGQTPSETARLLRAIMGR